MLELKNVSVRFSSASGVLAVDDVSMTLAPGSKTAIVGETGSGKSVLLLAIIRLLPPSAVVSGEILLDGENLLQADKRRLREVRGDILSYVPQGGGASLNPLLKVGFQVGEPLMEHRGYTKRRAFDAAVNLLKRFHLSDEKRLAHAYPHTFSGGMRQRVMIAMGIAAQAGIILADEPTKGLDDRRIDLVLQSFQQLREETLLCVTHDMRFARAVSQHICVMYAAQQVEFASGEDLFCNPLHPYTVDILNAMPENGMRYDATGFALSHEDYAEGCRYRDRCRQRFDLCAKTPPLFVKNGRKVRCWRYASEN